MKHVIRPVLMLTIAGSLVSCASSSEPRGERQPAETPERFSIVFRDDATRHVTTVQAPVDDVWSALPAVFRELGYPGAPATGIEYVFITPTMHIDGRLYPGESNSTYIDCGSGLAGPRANTYAVQFVIVTRVRPGAEGGSIVEIAVDGEARDRTRSINSVRCSGTGVLERAIGDMVASKVKR